MSETAKRGGTTTKAVAATALALGLGAGGYGVASAATGSGTGADTTAGSAAAAQGPAAPPAGNPWGGRRSDETLLTGETAAKVKAAAVAEIGSGATVVRVEIDADGHAAYEVHMVGADGTPVTVYVDEQFDVVGTESR